MNIVQRKSAAKFIYDIAKIVLTVAAIGNVFSEKSFNTVAVIAGTLSATLMFFFAYYLERKVEDE